MRAFAVLVALVATPFVVGVSQGLGHDAAHCAKRADQHPGKEINKCPSVPSDPPPPPPVTPPPPVEPPPPQPPPPVEPPPPPPPACAVLVPAPAGVQSIDGRVYNDLSTGRVGLANWCVELSLGGSVIGRAVTNGLGLYSFANLADGDYSVCEVRLEANWSETFPGSWAGAVCVDGFGATSGYALPIAGWSAGGMDFGNTSP